MKKNNSRDNQTGTSQEDVPQSLRQALLQILWQSRWRSVYIILFSLLLGIFAVWSTLPDATKQEFISSLGFTPDEKHSDSLDQEHMKKSDKNENYHPVGNNWDNYYRLVKDKLQLDGIDPEMSELSRNKISENEYRIRWERGLHKRFYSVKKEPDGSLNIRVLDASEEDTIESAFNFDSETGLVDCSDSRVQLPNTVTSLMSWSHYYHKRIVNSRDPARTSRDDCYKAIQYRGSAYCKNPENTLLKEALAETIALCTNK